MDSGEPEGGDTVMAVVHLDGAVIILAESDGRKRLSVPDRFNKSRKLARSAETPLGYIKSGDVHWQRRMPGLRVSIATTGRKELESVKTQT